jgi:sulfite oxidase
VPPALRLHARAPATAEPPLALLTHEWLTPPDLWYIRSHGPVPRCALAPPGSAEAEAHAVAITVPAAAPGETVTVTLSVAELRRRFARRTAVVTTQCGGNRRAHMNAAGGGATSGIPWGGGAISTAQWGGAALADVLAAAGVDLADPAYATWHVHFTGADGVVASVPAWRALSPRGDVLRAYDMAGAPLPPHHGAPLRAIAPGVVGVRSVKWLTGVTLAPREAAGAWQSGIAYKQLPPGVADAAALGDVAALPSVQEQPVTSVVASPAPGAVVPADAGVVAARGYAYAGGGRAVTRVDVSADGGATWQQAQLVAGADQPPGRAWAWVLWEAAVPIPPQEARPGGAVRLVARAVDEAGNAQPESAAPLWNLRGLNCNAWHAVDVAIGPPEAEEDE